MTLANTTSKILVYINGVDYSNFLIEGATSDDSAYSTNIITTTGSITLGGDTSILDYNKTLFPLGSKVNIYATLDNGNTAKLPRGQLYVLNSTIDVNTRQTTLELGCSLAYLVSRETYYASEVKSLITTFISTAVKGSFIIDDYNLSTLQSLLEIDGRIIFQDSWGFIQSVNQFGNDGLGSNLTSAKLTSFDKETAISIDSIDNAIEDLPSSILATASVEIPSSSTDEDEISATPPPFIATETFRNIKLPDALKEGFNSFFTIKNDPTSGNAGTEAVAGCGTITQPVAEAPSPYAYTAFGSCKTIELEDLETVTQGRYVSYEGAGNQVDFEYDFEYCSAATYASSVIRSVVEAHVNGANTEIEKSNSLLSKANQAYSLRDDYAGRSSQSAEETSLNQNAVEYYGCAADQYYDAAVHILEGASILASSATTFADAKTGVTGYSRMQQTFYTYGSNAEVIEKKQFNYIHTASSSAAQKAATATVPSFLDSPFLSKMRYKTAYDMNFYPFYTMVGKSFDATVKGDPLLTDHNEQKFKNPTTYFNLVLASQTVTQYAYGSIYNTELEEFTDFEDPFNSYVRKNYSSADGPEQPDRIETQSDGNGCVYANDDSSNTENKELSSEVKIDITDKIATPSIAVAWLGTPSAQTKEVQLPLDFAPIRTKICNGTKFVPDASAKLSIYSSILAKYASNLAKKITADNFGYRITEKGIRAELFEYYPFYPVSLNLASLNKKYKLRAASSSWAFDSENVLCSLDCFNVGVIKDSGSTVNATPSNYLAFTKVETTTTLTNAYFNLPETAASIKIISLPANGVLNLSGSPASVNDTITLVQINAGNVSFVPSSSGTKEVKISFEAFTSGAVQITSSSGIYPKLQLATFPTFVFADAGEFTDDTTNGGFPAGGGDFDTGTRPGGPYSLNGGDFDTGATVVVPEPQAPQGSSDGNNSVDPETQLGIAVVDSSDTVISTDTLATPAGNVNSNFEVIIDFKLTPSAYFNVSIIVLPQLGWNYKYITAPLGTSIDLASIVDPNNYIMNFGTISVPTEPVLASAVV